MDSRRRVFHLESAADARLWQKMPITPAPAYHLSVLEPDNSDFVSIGQGGAIALSPDGSQLAFVCSDSNGKRYLYVRPLDSSHARMLPGTEDATQPFWDTQGKRLGFFSNGKLKRIDLEGGAVVSLADAPTPRGGTWNQRNIILYAPNQRDGLFRISSFGGSAEKETTLDEKAGETSHRTPSFLPDGDHFLYLSTGARREFQRVFISKFAGAPNPGRWGIPGGLPRIGLPSDSLRTREGVVWVPGREGSSGLLIYLREGSLVAHKFDPLRLEFSDDAIPIAEGVGFNTGLNRADFSVSWNGTLAYRTGSNPTTQLMWFDRFGKELGTLGDSNLYLQPRLSSDGKHVAVERLDSQRGSADVWVLELERGIASRLTHDPAYDGFPVWSPDGDRILFMSEKRGSGNLFIKASSGAGREEDVLVTSDFQIPTDWSRDGKYLLFMSYNLRTVKSDLWVLPMFGDRNPIPCLQTEFDEIQGQFSPSGKWIAYSSDESGRHEVYVQSFPEPGGKTPFKLQISRNGGSQPRWSGDGKELFYVAPAGEMMLVGVRERKGFEADVPRVLFTTRMVQASSRLEYTVTQDGRRFLINTVTGGSESPPVSIMLDWLSRLDR